MIEAFLSFSCFVETYFYPYLENESPLSKGEKTSQRRVAKVHLLPFFGNLKLTDISGSNVQTYKIQSLDKGYRPDFINRHTYTLRLILRLALKLGHIQVVPQFHDLRRHPKGLPPYTSLVPRRFLVEEDPARKVDLDLLATRLERFPHQVNARQKRILEMCFGLIDGHVSTQKEIASFFNISKSRVEQIKEKALEKLGIPRGIPSGANGLDYLNRNNPRVLSIWELRAHAQRT